MPQKQVFIHAGAHRTGTSSLQNCMAANREILQAEGFDLGYPGRDGAPGGRLALRLPQPRHGREKNAEFEARCRKVLEDHSSDSARKLVVSEENLPGRMMHFYGGKFFPGALRRMRVFKRAVPGQVAHLVYVLRSYDALFVSAFRKRSEDNRVEPFEEIAGNMAAFEGGWPLVVAALRDGMKPARLTVIEYSRRGESRDLLATLVGGDAARLIEPERQLNESATDAALFELQRRYHAGETLKRSEWRQVIQDTQDHPQDREPRGYAAFSAEQSAVLQARYADDLDVVAGMDGVTLIR